jgi:hypothetical protein
VKATASQLVTAFVGQHNVLTIPRPVLEALEGDYPAAVLLGQVIYWSERKEDGWFHKSYAEWGEELCLTEYLIRKATRKLEKLGIVETDLRKVGGAPTLHYRFKRDDFSEWILKKLQIPSLKDFRNDTEKTSDSYIDTETTTETTYRDTTLRVGEPLENEGPPSETESKPQDLKQFAVAELMKRVRAAQARGAPVHDPIDRDRAQYARFFATRAKVHEVEILLLVLDYMVSKASGKIEGEPKAWCGFDTALDAVLAGWRPPRPRLKDGGWIETEEQRRLREEVEAEQARIVAEFRAEQEADAEPPPSREEIRRMLREAKDALGSRSL